MSCPPPYTQQPYGQGYPPQPGFHPAPYPPQQQPYYPPNQCGYPSQCGYPQGYPQQGYPPQGYGYPQPQIVARKGISEQLTGDPIMIAADSKGTTVGYGHCWPVVVDVVWPNAAISAAMLNWANSDHCISAFLYSSNLL
ncbi:unnamed protein product [Anisakis simplex]|uniref:Cysteine-rich and transmembrane domain-containing protein 1 n=1 Tax=Anisakis simplex TaxID=6269 RepID=A0A0M3JR02_ANISI|nr:unnamed protein product [Anisakis simplex]